MDKQELLKIAVKCAELGGGILEDYRNRVDPSTIETKRMGDWVSEADRASENLILKYLAENVPDHNVLTEEAGYRQGEKDCKYRWIIDPLDGTTNYLRHFPIWSVSIAVEKRTDPEKSWGDIEVGVISIPLQNEIFWAVAGEGAFRNGRRIYLGDEKPFNSSLLATGFPFRTRHLIEEYMQVFSEIMKNCADVRRAGSVAVDLCYVAAGIFDGFWELDLAPWDIAAGGLIVREAGGLASNFQGGEDFLTTGDIVAGHPGTYRELIQYVKARFPETRNVDKSVRVF